MTKSQKFPRTIITHWAKVCSRPNQFILLVIHIIKLHIYIRTTGVIVANQYKCIVICSVGFGYCACANMIFESIIGS